MRERTHKQALINVVNLLGPPRKTTCHSCEGCEFERQEAVCEGLIALGYLDPPTYRMTHTSTNARGGECQHFEFDGPQPDRMDAYRRFMKEQFDVELI
jgi:hypothetical protein